MTEKLSDTTEDLGSAPLGRLLLRLSLPSVASLMTMTVYQLVDTFWVARLGHESIAAMTIVLPFFIMVIAVGAGSGVGANALASRCFGERNPEASNRVAGQTYILTAFFGLIFIVAAAFFAEPILEVFGATPDIIGLATDYLVVFGYAAPFMLFRMITSNIFRASGDAIKPMTFQLTSTIVNVILDPFLIFGWGPFPEMGIKGAALATVIAASIGAGLSFYYLTAHKSAYRIKLHHIKPDLSIIRDIYKVGLPTMIMEVAESIVFSLFNRVIVGYGSISLAAAGIAFRILDFAFMPIIGGSHGLLPVVGFCLGARLWDRLWKAVRIASVSSSAVMGLATIIMLILAPQIVGIFNKDPELMAVAVPAVRILLSTFVILGPSIMFITAFQGLSKGTEALVLTLVRQFLFFIPLLYLLSEAIGIYGVWISLPFSDILAFTVSAAWLYREYRKQQRDSYWLHTTGPEG
jgi:putative MATE family efflux protein